MFGGCAYLGLNHDPRVHRAIAEALARFGTSSSASRETTGNTTAHLALEATLRDFFGFPGALLAPDGYIANIAALQGLAHEHDLLILDERSHRSLTDAAAAAHLPILTYPHQRAHHALELAHTHASQRPLIATDGVFAATGAVSPIADLASGLPTHARLLVDDCHGVAVLGRGLGSVEHAGLRGHPRIVITTSLAKGVGVAGGAIVGSQEVERLARTAASSIGSTPIGPALALGTCEALRTIRAGPHHAELLAINARSLHTVLARHGRSDPFQGTPIFPWTPTDDPERMGHLHESALARGILLPRISYPGGPSADYFRLSITSHHTSEHLAQLDATLSEILA